jgi:hypothetical protein
MRILFKGEEHQVTLEAKGNTIVAGEAISWNGNLLEGVEDITEYDDEGNEVVNYPIDFDEAEGVPV